MQERQIDFFKHTFLSGRSAFKKTDFWYERGGDIVSRDGKLHGFVCFIPEQATNKELYAYENLTDTNLKRLKMKINLSDAKYHRAMRIENLDEVFDLNKSSDPKNTSAFENYFHRKSSSGIDLKKINYTLEEKFDLFVKSWGLKFFFNFTMGGTISFIASSILYFVLLLISYPFQTYVRKLTVTEWDWIFYGCLLFPPVLIIMALIERLEREESTALMYKNAEASE